MTTPQNNIPKREVEPAYLTTEERDQIFSTIKAALERGEYHRQAPGYDPDGGFERNFFKRAIRAISNTGRRVTGSASRGYRIISMVFQIAGIIVNANNKGTNIMEDRRAWTVVISALLTFIGVQVSPEFLSTNIEALIEGAALVITAVTALWMRVRHRLRQDNSDNENPKTEDA